MALLSRLHGYVRRPTPWAASTCPRTAQSWKTCAHWCECVRSRPRFASRGTHFYLCHSQYLKQYLPICLFSPFSLGYYFWDNKLKNLKSWRIKIPSWFEELWVCNVVLKQGKRRGRRGCGTLGNPSSVRSALGPVLHLKSCSEVLLGLWVGLGEGVESNSWTGVERFSGAALVPRPCKCRLFVDVISML